MVSCGRGTACTRGSTAEMVPDHKQEALVRLVEDMLDLVDGKLALEDGKLALEDGR